MDQAPENNLPPAGLRLAGDVAHQLAVLRQHITACERENSDLRDQLARVTDQWQQAEAHNRELRDDLAALRGWVQGELKAARAAIQVDRYGQDPKVRLQAFTEMWQHIKPVV